MRKVTLEEIEKHSSYYKILLACFLGRNACVYLKSGEKIYGEVKKNGNGKLKIGDKEVEGLIIDCFTGMNRPRNNY
jgi:hypothetical protein